MEWEINKEERPENNQPEPIIQQPIPQEPAPVAVEPMQKEPIQNEPACKLSGFSYFFGKTFSVYKNNFWTFLLISAIPFIASLLSNNSSLSSLILYIPVLLIVIIISLWSSLSILYAVKERENKMSFGRALAAGWSGLGPYIWVSFLVFIIVAGGLILFIIPGIIFSIWFSLSLYVLVSEGKKGMSALKRSKELISGYLTAYWGRTLLFSLIFFVILLLFSFIIGLFSAFLPILDYIPIILNVMAAPLFAIFSFLVYEDIKKAKDSGCAKSPREIKYILMALFLFIVPIIGILASIVLINVNSAVGKAKETQIQAYMSQTRMVIEMYAAEKAGYSYSGASCQVSPDFISVCNSIKEAAGSEPTIHSSAQNYCLYVKLPGGGYYCLNEEYNYGSSDKKDIFPGGAGYCDGITFNCP